MPHLSRRKCCQSRTFGRESLARMLHDPFLSEGGPIHAAGEAPMKSQSRILLILAGLTVLPLLLGAYAPVQTDESWITGDDYLAGEYGRVRSHENGVTVQRTAYDPGAPPLAEADVNAPVYPGDTLLCDYDQRAEVELAEGSLVRIDRGTEITFLALPDPYSEVADNTVLQLAEGTIQVTAYLNEMQEFRIDTPAASIYLLGDGDFRIEVDAHGRTRLISHRGVAELVGDGGSVLVRGGTMSEVYAGSYPLAAEPFNTFAADSFDGWVQARESAYAVSDRYTGDPHENVEVYEELPEEVQPYYRELSGYGDWVDTTDYGFVWVPAGVTAEWRPYYDGYWDYGPGGYFWVSNEPWGWAPYHYGRWAWVAGYGWAWIPGRMFGGAWVAWSWGDAYVGWAPLDYWNTPLYVGPAYYGYYDRYCWTFISYEHLTYRRYPRYAVPIERVGSSLEHTAVVTRPPRIPPSELASTPLARDRAVARSAADREARIRFPHRDRRPALTMRDAENGLARQAGQARPGRSTAEARPGPARGRGDGRSAPPTRSRATASPGTSGASRRGGSAAIPGRSATRPSPGGPPGSQAVSPAPTGRSGTTQSADRVRDLYRKAAAPRTTQKRSTPRAGPSSSSGPAGGARSPGRNVRVPGSSTSGRSNKATTRGTTGSGSSRRSVSPPRGSSRREAPRSSARQPSGSSSRGGSKKARPPAPRSGSKKQGASPRRSPSGTGGSRQGAKPNRSPSRSGGSKPSASPGRSRSGGGGSRATSGGSRSSQSRSGSAAPSRGGAGSRSGGKRGRGGKQ
jgi:hypothetical protein